MFITCFNCGRENQADANYCDECGVGLLTAVTEGKYEDDLVLPNIDESEFVPHFTEILDDLDDTLQHPSRSNSKVAIQSPVSKRPTTPHKSQGLAPVTSFQPLTPALICQDTHAKFELPLNKKIINIGRRNDRFSIHVDLTNIARADLISRIHASIHQENGIYYLEDAGSANGTWLNGKLIKPGARFSQQLHHGDTIAFGRSQTVKFQFELS